MLLRIVTLKVTNILNVCNHLATLPALLSMICIFSFSIVQDAKSVERGCCQQLFPAHFGKISLKLDLHRKMGLVYIANQFDSLHRLCWERMLFSNYI